MGQGYEKEWGQCNFPPIKVLSDPATIFYQSGFTVIFSQHGHTSPTQSSGSESEVWWGKAIQLSGLSLYVYLACLPDGSEKPDQRFQKSAHLPTFGGVHHQCSMTTSLPTFSVRVCLPELYMAAQWCGCLWTGHPCYCTCLPDALHGWALVWLPPHTQEWATGCGAYLRWWPPCEILSPLGKVSSILHLYHIWYLKVFWCDKLPPKCSVVKVWQTSTKCLPYIMLTGKAF